MRTQQTQLPVCAVGLPGPRLCWLQQVQPPALLCAADLAGYCRCRACNGGVWAAVMAKVSRMGSQARASFSYLLPPLDIAPRPSQWTHHPHSPAECATAHSAQRPEKVLLGDWCCTCNQPLVCKFGVQL